MAQAPRTAPRAHGPALSPSAAAGKAAGTQGMLLGDRWDLSSRFCGIFPFPPRKNRDDTVKKLVKATGLVGWEKKRTLQLGQHWRPASPTVSGVCPGG